MPNKKTKLKAPGSKKQASAKHAYKKKQKSSTKFKNEELRENLDQQVQAIYTIPTSKSLPCSDNDLTKNTIDINGLMNSFGGL